MRALSRSTNVSRVRCQPGAICVSSLLLVLALPRGFFSGLSDFPPSSKTNTPNSDSTGIEDLHENQLRLMWLPVSKYCDLFVNLQLKHWKHLQLINIGISHIVKLAVIHLVPTWDERAAKHGIEVFWDKNLFSWKPWQITVRLL